MGKGLGSGLVLAFGFGLSFGVSSGWAQVREIDTKVTGPGGRTIERSLRSERGPGFLDRQTTITRPGGTFQRDVRIQSVPGGFRPGGFVPRGGYVPRGWGWGGWGPRPVIVENRGVPLLPALAVGGGLFGLGMLTGSALSAPPPPPPVVYANPPVVVAAPPPTVVYNPPQPYSPTPPPPATVVVDPVAQALGRLQSHHDNSRREGAAVLGRLRDPRAVPALVDRLKNDWSKDVRVAAATALGEIGDPRAETPLERASIYDKRQDVRNAAIAALSRIQSAATATANAPVSTSATTTAGPLPDAASVPNLQTAERVPPPPTPAYPSGTTRAR